MPDITQVISVYSGTVPSRLTQTQIQFDAATDSWLVWENLLPAQINTWSSQANSLRTELNNLNDDAEAAKLAAQAAQTAAENAAIAGAAAAGAPVYPTGSPYALGACCSGSDGQTYRSLIADNATDPVTHSENWLCITNAIKYVPYDDRGDLRTGAVSTQQHVLIDGLGLFRFELNSTEPDDDESCFATATGRWLLECVHWDVVDSWQLPDDEVRDEVDEDTEAWIDSAETRYPGRVLFGTATQSITSVAATTQVNFTGTIAGAAVGNHVLVTPPTALEARISVFARVTAANTVTIYLNNPSASTASLTTGTWKVAIIQES